MTTIPAEQHVSVQEAARRAGVSPGTLTRWVREGLIPQYDGDWTQSAVGHARVVARLRERGHSLDDIRRAQADGRLAFGYIEELLPRDEVTYTLRDAAREMTSHPPREVLVTRPVAEAAGAHLACERIGEVRLKGFSEATEIFIARRREEG
jgi:DNA-binding transcriptional MerR regulator